MKVLRPYGNGMTQAAVEATSDVLTSGELDDEIENNYDAIRAALPAWTSTRIRYKAGATEAEIWDPGEKPQKIFLPLNDGWYLPEKQFGIPNGQPSDSGNPAARHLWRWQDREYSGLVARGCGWWGGGFRRDVYAYYGPDGRLGVCVRDEKVAAPTSDVLLEALAALEHEQWVAWSKDLASKEKLSADRIKRWKSLWGPYTKLSEEMKEHDRKWARKALEIVEGETV